MVCNDTSSAKNSQAYPQQVNLGWADIAADSALGEVISWRLKLTSVDNELMSEKFYVSVYTCLFHNQ